MKKTMVGLMLLVSLSSMASVNTLSLESEEEDGEDTLCIYSNGQRTEVYVKEGAGSCPSKMTFH